MDRHPVRPRHTFSYFDSFELALPWNWLSKASSLIVQRWVAISSNHTRNVVIINLALANCGGIKAPVCAYVKIIRHSACLARHGVASHVQRLYRLFLNHSAQVWKGRGIAAVRQWLRSPDADLSLMADYLFEEGFAQGMPTKNSSWTSLLRRSEDWHRRVALQHSEEEQEEFLEWNSLLPETIIGDVVCVPLRDSRALALEGHELTHCVRIYAARCYQGKYRVFSLTEPDGTRSTLGMRLGRKGSVVHDQHYGPHNSSVSQSAATTAKQLLAAYRQALRETPQLGGKTKVEP